VTEAPFTGVRVEPLPNRTLLLLEVWEEVSVVEHRLGSALPGPGQALAAEGWRALWWEPGTWLIRLTADDGPALPGRVSAALDSEGAATDVSGAFRRIALEGPAWRSLLMIGGVFDAESPDFGPGCVAGTVIHRIPVHLDVLSPTTVEAFVPPSYLEEMLHHWRRSAVRLSNLG
jgi:heterotetrameric sarcosine oxidase gamma subunit